ncbi:MAG: hypothetical protein K6B40_04545 [Firmicutes bacterium]|nr:hypothetical protein [Bacillota bacterium]
MPNWDWETMPDAEFEAVLENTVAELPPEDIVTEVTPWRKATDRVLFGMALTSITFQFLYLHYILPAIGAVLVLLGFRALRRENKWFGYCFALSVLQTASGWLWLILHTTIVPSIFYASSMEKVGTVVKLLMLLLMLICLRQGFLAVQRKAGLSPHAGGAVALMVWYALLCLFAFMQYSGVLIVFMLIGYVCIIRNLFALSKELDAAGYAIQTAPNRITDRCVVGILALCLLVGGVCGYLFGGQYPMDWSMRNAAEHEEVKEIKAHLTSLGFPAEVLNDVCPEDIAACRDALQVVVDTTVLPVQEGEETTPQYLSDKNPYRNSRKTVAGPGKLRFTDVGVQIPGERERWMIFHHFLWTTSPGFFGAEAIQLWTPYMDPYAGWYAAGDVTGRVLYDRDGETFVADYYALGPQTLPSNAFFWGSQIGTNMFAAFSMPGKGQRHRGYIAYSVDRMHKGNTFSSYYYYIHQQSRLQYPVQTAIENKMNSFWTQNGAFRTFSGQLHFLSQEDGIEIFR